LRVAQPHSFLVLMAVYPMLVGIGLIRGKASRPSGVVLPTAFAVAILYFVRASRDHAFLKSEEVGEEPRSYLAAVGLTVVGLVVIAVGGELVTWGHRSSSLCSGYRRSWSAWR